VGKGCLCVLVHAAQAGRPQLKTVRAPLLVVGGGGLVGSEHCYAEPAGPPWEAAKLSAGEEAGHIIYSSLLHFG
jgi:hypothetical protein